MKFSIFLAGSLCALSLTSCLENLKIPGVEDTQTNTITATSTQTDCSSLEANIDFTFDVNEQTNIVNFDASESQHEQCSGSTDFDSYSWNFGDGTITTSSTPTTLHQYQQSGQFSVTLTASFDDTDISTTREVAINHPQICVALASQAYFTHSTNADGSILFDASSSYVFEDCAYQEIEMYIWDFGDGQTVETPNNMVSHFYEHQTEHLVHLTVVTADHTYIYLDIIGTHESIIQECIDTAFIHTTSTGHRFDFDVLYGPAECDEIEFKHIWYFGDGASSTEQNPYYFYETPGEYFVTLELMHENYYNEINTAISSQGSTETCIAIEPSFSINAEKIDENIVHFNAQTMFFGDSCNSSPILAYYWNTGDGTEYGYEDSEINHAYSNPGVYTVTLLVLTANGINYEASYEIVIEPSQCNADENVIQTYVHELTATFDASDAFGWNCNAQDSHETYFWEFGNGQTATTTAPFITHEYFENNGEPVYVFEDYVVTVTNQENVSAQGDVSINYATICTDDIPVSYCTEPEALLTIDVISSSDSGRNVQFAVNDRSYNSQDNTYEWTISNHQTASGNSMFVDFDQSGTYTVMVKATRADQSVLATTIDFVVESQYCLPPTLPIYTQTETAIWTDYGTDTGTETELYDPIAPPPEGNIEVVIKSFKDNKVTFQMLWENSGCDTFVWDFGDGTILESTDMIVSHEYQENGDYFVYVGDGYNNGFAEVNLTDDSACPYLPNTGFFVTSNVHLNVSLNTVGASNCVGESTYIWDFGDGNTLTSTEQFVSHTYQHEGTYIITQSLLEFPEINPLQRSISVESPIDLNYSYELNLGNAQFNAYALYYGIELAASPNTESEALIAPIDDFTYEWDFGDGNTATGGFVEHTYVQSGTYQVVINAIHNFTQNNLVREFTIHVNTEIEPPKQIDIALTATGSGQSFLFNSSYTINYTDQLDLYYEWDFGDGETTSAYHLYEIFHTYEQAGTYEVTLSITDQYSNPPTTSSESLTVEVTQ